MTNSVEQAFIVGAFQGHLGWYMVQSGLEDRFDGPSDTPRVSQYRLASHLGMAFLLYSLMLWSSLGVLLPAENVPAGVIGNAAAVKRARLFRRLAHTSKGLVFLTALSGTLICRVTLFCTIEIKSCLSINLVVCKNYSSFDLDGTHKFTHNP